jgi:sterol desaturase/sphingolipid hydroxylase (fatty acid hydroxylase superfamily)
MAEILSTYYDQLKALMATDEFQRVSHQAISIVTGILALTVVLEFISIETVKGVWKQPNGRELYIKAILLNLINPAVFGIPLYSGAVTILCSEKENETITFRDVSEILWVLGVHGICYYQVHKMFHESPRLYRFHKYHHRFNTHVPPSAANAVEFQEYILAYLLPFVVAIVTRQTATENLAIAVWIISVLNLLVHTPKLDGTYNLGKYSVSTKNHMDHHKKLKVHYASPIFNIDTLVELFSKKE